MILPIVHSLSLLRYYLPISFSWLSSSSVFMCLQSKASTHEPNLILKVTHSSTETALPAHLNCQLPCNFTISVFAFESWTCSSLPHPPALHHPPIFLPSYISIPSLRSYCNALLGEMFANSLSQPHNHLPLKIAEINSQSGGGRV